ncbi:MAG: hypothetical protein SOZ40_00225 [Ezakiella sp.]|nr:hypothetical protein [Ezakiella sp.]
MTKRQNKIIIAIELCLLIALGVFYYFNHVKMGMMRWTVYQNYVIEKSKLSYLIILIASFLVGVGVYFTVNKRPGVMPIYFIFFVAALLLKSKVFKYEFYFILMIISLCLLLELLRIYLNKRLERV